MADKNGLILIYAMKRRWEFCILFISGRGFHRHQVLGDRLYRNKSEPFYSADP
jgi:hypothetical protein